MGQFCLFHQLDIFEGALPQGLLDNGKTHVDTGLCACLVTAALTADILDINISE